MAYNDIPYEKIPTIMKRYSWDSKIKFCMDISRGYTSPTKPDTEAIRKLGVLPHTLEAIFLFAIMHIEHGNADITERNNSMLKLKAFADDYGSIIEELQNIKYELENALNNLSCDLVDSILKMFNKMQDCSLAGLLTELYQNDWKQKKQKSFDYYTNAVLELTSNL